METQSVISVQFNYQVRQHNIYGYIHGYPYPRQAWLLAQHVCLLVDTV